MAAYLIADVRNRIAYDVYWTEVGELLEKHGGQYVVRPGETEIGSREWRQSRLVILRFPNESAIRTFFADPGQERLTEIRKQAIKHHYLMVTIPRGSPLRSACQGKSMLPNGTDD